MFKYLKNYEINKFKNHKRPYMKYWFKFIYSKIEYKSGETVPLNALRMNDEHVQYTY
jgi:hypothetical protein